MNRFVLFRSRRATLLAAAALTAIAAPAAAQQAGVAPPEPTPPGGAAAPAVEQPSEADIIVTGTSRARIALDTPLAVTSVDEGRLAKTGVSSQADILNTIPTIKADAGGGEVATNVFIRGLPSGGQYQFTPLMYDGIPVFSTFGLNSSAFDVYFRNDLGLERLEFVRGGVSNLFGPGSVAGLINYMTKTGGEETHGTVQLEAGQRDRYRGDAAISGPLGGNLYYALSGYYRYDEGPIRTGLDTKGYQIRGNLKYKFPDNSGSVTLYGQWIDDQVQFYLPVPLDGRSRSRIAGNDGNKVKQVMTPDVAGIGYNTPDGRFQTDITDGVRTRGGQVALAFDKDLGGDWGINGRAKYSEYKHKFGLWSDGDGIVNVPETLQGFLTNRNLGTLANATFTYADDGSAVPGNYLLFANRFTDRNRPAHDFTAELNVTKDLTTGAVEHTFTLGGFYADAWARDENVTTTILAEFNNQPRLVNLSVRNPTTGAVTVVSAGGLSNAGNTYVNNRHSAERYAAYFADQMEAGRFNFDLGGRIERFKGEIRRERTATFVTDTTTPNLATPIRDVQWGNDTFLTANVDATAWAIAAGALYKVSDTFNIYANASRGFFFPEIRSVTFNALGQPASYKEEVIKQAEVGVKYGSGPITATLAGLYTELSNRRQVLFINAPGGGLQEVVNIVATRSYGLEATLSARITRALRFEGNVTLQDHKYTEFDTTPANIGNELERQPNILYNAGLYYDDGALDASFFTNYTGNNYTAANNAIKLESFNVFNLDAGYKVPIGANSVRVGVNVFNLFNTDATTEGSPRQDASQTTGGAYFVGRPVLPRRILARATFSF
ncbi:TonB-dependent receptor [Sphingomonas jatrophae]|uniref:Outer membrane receptor proteins, mostly Fe transport n=1 Tax=Sphingomonas jatrophae TaxID=1166337 RepID=A0A1I6K881_9SPHN|nr:TonB-dependent receptor [Sphingomonas jatrophae]SFR87407.1 Outer membrane receptor proteins, mostly Fe transport [Sphingomonas jatrophae]